ncbi:hypothetical protein C2E21_9262 [Chlorella sorokiniana]|uniref:Uncharacterized protein n=1 Tax=Chlorella sorokiniana TaxID=3076 RepID=A0A2P6TBX8_CHLSO|nr:hypothetical protein C2E21_9262 [Chlorella sorokiniana]|eukprot:PRW18398.1 hypothetical protein C2E21_9262 [Chlorella sorokiniana]
MGDGARHVPSTGTRSGHCKLRQCERHLHARRGWLHQGLAPAAAAPPPEAGPGASPGSQGPRPPARRLQTVMQDGEGAEGEAQLAGAAVAAVVAQGAAVGGGGSETDPVTAIIGGGLAGLACAHELAQAYGLRSVVFDTGEHGVGGRLATRSSADGSLKGAPPGLVFDHAAQFFTASDPAFCAMVERWAADSAVARWRGPVGRLRDGAFQRDDSQERWVAPGGMRALAHYLAGQARRGGDLERLVEVRRPQWVNTARHTADGWQLFGRGLDQGTFDAVVIAHNGKCANRLSAPMGVPDVHAQLKRLRLSANWVLMAAFASPVPVPGGLEGAFIERSDVLSWAGNNSAKLGLPDGPQCWTLVSTQTFGKANKVPQENVPPEVAERVTRDMLAAFERSLGLPRGALPPVVFTKTQLWGAALPLNSPRVPCIWDPVGRAGVCGDWVADGGSMQAAALSGKAMAEWIAASRGRRPTDVADLALGLSTPLKPAAGEAIGQFPAGDGSARGAAAAPRQQQQQPSRQQQQQRPSTQQRQQQRQPAAAGAGVAAKQRGKEPAGTSAAAPQLLSRPVRPGS